MQPAEGRRNESSRTKTRPSGEGAGEDRTAEQHRMSDQWSRMRLRPKVASEVVREKMSGRRAARAEGPETR